MHEQHRERLRTRARAGFETFYDHELLELLLFNSKPRVNTNHTAHLLLQAFGSLSGVLNASYEELLKVKGVGPATATTILGLRELTKRVMVPMQTPNSNTDINKDRILSLEQIKSTLVANFTGATSESFVIYYLDINLNVIEKSVICGNYDDEVEIDLGTICRQVVHHAPTYALVSHNHLTSNISPSRNDILTTERLYFILSANKVKLLDHIIVNRNNVFSFYHEHLLDKIEKKVDGSFKEKTVPPSYKSLSDDPDSITPHPNTPATRKNKK